MGVSVLYWLPVNLSMVLWWLIKINQYKRGFGALPSIEGSNIHMT